MAVNGGQINPFDNTGREKSRPRTGTLDLEGFACYCASGIKEEVWPLSRSGFGFYLQHGAEEEANNCESWQSVGLGKMGVRCFLMD